jgi:outer membrane protein assembly factor BamB
LGTSTSDWPQWRGPERNGISPEKDLLKEWSKEGPKLLWQVNDIGDGFSTPAVVGTRIYLMSNRGMENEFVQALSIQDGKPIWTTRIGNVGNPNQNPPYPKARSTPTVDGDFIYALGSDGDLACLETGSGKIRWQKSLRKEFGGQPHEWAYADLYGSEMGEHLLAVEFTTGKVIWKAESLGRASVAYADGLLYVHGWNGDVALVEATPEGYREKGRFTPPAQPKHKQAEGGNEMAFAYPVIANGRLYIRDLGTLWAYDIKASR